jgi:type II secretory pathway component PulK
MMRSRKGSALLISLIVLTLVTVMSTVFFEKLFRFSQASEGIENSNIAYYKALGIIETAMYGVGVDKYTPWNIKNATSGGNYLNS